MSVKLHTSERRAMGRRRGLRADGAAPRARRRRRRRGAARGHDDRDLQRRSAGRHRRGRHDPRPPRRQHRARSRSAAGRTEPSASSVVDRPTGERGRRSHAARSVRRCWTRCGCREDLKAYRIANLITVPVASSSSSIASTPNSRRGSARGQLPAFRHERQLAEAGQHGDARLDPVDVALRDPSSLNGGGAGSRRRQFGQAKRGCGTARSGRADSNRQRIAARWASGWARRDALSIAPTALRLRRRAFRRRMWEPPRREAAAWCRPRQSRSRCEPGAHQAATDDDRRRASELHAR